MIKYWPSQQSIKLNNAIVELFLLTEKKFAYNLANNTKYYLYIDILNNKNKCILFKIILSEFKNLVLNLIEINVSQKQLKYLNNKIFIIFIQTTLTKFKLNTKYQKKNNNITIEFNNYFLVKELITYLIFGSAKINIQMFSFDPIYTPYKHVQILFENFIIQSANLIIKNIMEELGNSASIYTFLKEENKFNQLYTSNRSIILFLNNLKLQESINLYVYRTKSLYNEREQIWLISSKGIITKYIPAYNIEGLKSLNEIQAIFLFWLEIKDLTIPKLERVIIQIGKYTTYFIVNFLSNLILLLIRVVIFYLSK
uniref:Ycf55 n=1 Tax=Laurencia catarinensis TaxID=197326 RepID=UPI0028D84F1E|nr:Ycf55 [Laurencia catarinensis]WMP12386.1 Ycf55 [Laurencia catarinensis]